VSKNLARCRSENNFVGPSNNYLFEERLSVDDNAAKSFDILTINLSFTQSWKKSWFFFKSKKLDFFKFKTDFFYLN